jgi:DNA-binding NarL/FixJ family response regulator
MLPIENQAFTLPEQSLPIRVLVVDDEPKVRQEIRSIVNSNDYLEVIGEAGDGETAIELARKLQPEVVLMDVTLPTMSGIETTRQMTSEFPHLAIVGLSVHESQLIVQAMAAAGAAAYLTKETATENLSKAIGAALLACHHSL